MSTNEPLLRFSITGGAPPATSQLLALYANGELEVTIGNSWPNANPQNEVGIYRHRLTEQEIAQILQHTEAVSNMDEWYGEKLPGGLHYQLSLQRNDATHKVSWDHFAEIPGELETYSKLLQQLLKESRSHSVQTIKGTLELTPSDTTTLVTLHLANTGTAPITILVPEHPVTKERMLLLGASDEPNPERVDVPALYGGAESLPFDSESQRLIIEAGERLSFSTSSNLPAGKEWYGMAELQLEVQGEITDTLYCFLVTEGVKR